MEIPVINRMTDTLNNPSLISRILSTLELGKITHAHRFWKWGALFLALAYAFSSLINKIKIFIYYYHNKSKSLFADATEPLLSHFDDAFLSSDDEDDVVSVSSSDNEEDDDDDEEDEKTTDFNVKGSFGIFSERRGQKGKFELHRRRRSFVDNFSLCGLVNGNGVVKLWDGLSLGVVDVDNAFSFLDFNDYNNNNNNNLISGSVFDPVFISGGSGLGIWDIRTGENKPVVHSEWKGKVLGVDSGLTGKVYVRDDVTNGLVVGDMRKVDSPLTEYEEDMWWEANGVNGLED